MTTDIMATLKEPRMIKICAPMVRYSKLQFRTLVRRYGCDICYTPMIMADSFVRSSKARQNEFTTYEQDRPLIVQFAAKTVEDFIGAAEMVAPYCNGVDLNCGCPQRWAMKEGYGANLLRKPELDNEVYRMSYNTRLTEECPLTKEKTYKYRLCIYCGNGLKFITICFAALTFAITAMLVLQILYTENIPQKSLHGIHGAVITDYTNCSQIGTKILRKSNNAVDAAIAATICMNVVAPHKTGLGGET